MEEHPSPVEQERSPSLKEALLATARAWDRQKVLEEVSAWKKEFEDAEGELGKVYDQLLEDSTIVGKVLAAWTAPTLGVVELGNRLTGFLERKLQSKPSGHEPEANP